MTAEATTPPIDPADADQWSAKVRNAWLENLPPEKLLPDRQPAYVASWIYVFGVATLSALGVVILTGLTLSLAGPAWWHESSIGHFVNSVHLWSVELFFFTMVVHLWGKFFMAAWRGKRALTWMTGCVCFFASIVAGFTGYVSQSNFDAQWISTQAKDGFNSSGLGAFFNALNYGQMLTLHITVLPIAVGIVVLLHVLLVRKKGVVPPFAVAGETPDETTTEVAGA